MIPEDSRASCKAKSKSVAEACGRDAARRRRRKHGGDDGGREGGIDWNLEDLKAGEGLRIQRDDDEEAAVNEEDGLIVAALLMATKQRE